ncbi:MAG: transposase [Magnetococcales bacterium]|nr:transposase [Magnetococcales bacterium]
MADLEADHVVTAPTPFPLWATPQELAGLPEMPGTVRRATSRATREGWSRQKHQGRGGGWEYAVSALPAATQVAWVERHREVVTLAEVEGLCEAARRRATQLVSRRATAEALPAETSIPSPSAQELERAREQGLALYNQATPYNREAADGRLEILEAWWRYEEAQQPRNQKAGMAQFLALVAAGGVYQFSVAAERQLKRGVSPRSLLRWDLGQKKTGLQAVVARFGCHKGRTVLSREQQDFVVAMSIEFPHASYAMIHEAMRVRFGSEIPSESALLRYRHGWMEKNESVWLSLTNPDKWRSRFKTAQGSKAEEVVRLNQTWEMDSTWADVMLADGKRHTILGVIDIYTRRVRYLVSRTSRATAVTALIRKAILDWGVPERIRTDNGSDYVSKHVVLVMKNLDIHQEVCRPFTPEDKPFIERSFRSFSHGIVELLPGFVGHSVEERKAIESRESFAQRLMKKPGGTGERYTVALRLTADELQDFCDQWADTVNTHKAHRGEGMNGMTPFQKLSTWTEPVRRVKDERALDLLLAPAPKEPTRTIRKKGIEIDGRWYQAPEMAAHPGRVVEIGMDEGDLGRIFVFSGGRQEFLFMAQDPAWTGVSRQEIAVAARVIEQHTQKEAKKQLREIMKKADVRDIHREVMTQKARDAGKLVEFPGKPFSGHATPGLTAAGQAAQAADATPLPVYSAEEQQRFVDLRARLQEKRPVVHEESPAERYARALRLEQSLAEGEEMTAQEREFLEIYRESPEYKTQKLLSRVRAANG